ncbi:CDP-alcohol phosphatidyltransferase family protein [Actinoplanes sp. NPDC049596]|uniref:CDP-alcohol phosphatidyltransferase family protein n=1 Tax=unclassified Actinoplanes TaxID=2626549 RepID=UPI0034344B58
MARHYTLGEIRSRTYKDKDAWWTVLLVDPLASRLIRLVAPFRSVTPNRLTVLAFLVGLGSALCFWRASYPWLLAGALLFHLSFVLDCMDGKIARLREESSAFGSWLDYVFDRLRVLACAVGLFGGQYEATHNFMYVWLAGLVIFLDMFRYLNALEMGKVRAELTKDDVPPPVTETQPSAPVGATVAPGWWKYRNLLVGRRIRPHLFSGIEFMMFVFIVGPLVHQVIVATIFSAVMLTAFELLLIYRFRNFTKVREAAAARRPSLSPL